MSHDPRREVAKLRDHLAAHDRPLAFLFGAGTSASVLVANGDEKRPLIPAVAELTAIARARVEHLGPKFASAIEQIAADAAPPDRAANIEDILSAVRQMLAAVGGDTLAGLSRDELARLERTIRETIASEAVVDESSIPNILPHIAFASWVAAIPRQDPVELFTTNYDILFERALEDARVPVFDGFVGSYLPFFDPSSFERFDATPPASWVRVWKIHGSVNWHWVDRPDGRRIARLRPEPSGELILPSHLKYDESRKQPYVALLDHFRRVLNRNTIVLVTCGYSFADQHINGIIFDALDNRRLTHAIALMHSDADEAHALIQKALQRRNLLVLGPKYGVVGGRRAPWVLAEPVDNAAATFMDLAFDSDAKPEPNDVATTGKLRLGDFKWFTAFLGSVGPDGA